MNRSQLRPKMGIFKEPSSIVEHAIVCRKREGCGLSGSLSNCTSKPSLACLLSTISRCRRKSAFEGSSPQLYRINLLSFRDERTVSFYKNRGFEIVGEEEGLDQMEPAPSRAFEWLKDEGYDI
jgi:hypothetical protein